MAKSNTPKESQILEVGNNELSFAIVKPNFTAYALGISKATDGRFHLIEISFDPILLKAGEVTSIYNDALEEDVREKFQIESARRDFQWGF